MTGTLAASGSTPRVPVLTVLPADPEQMEIGGIASFVRGFVKFAPDDFELSFVGVSSTREAWTWHRLQLEGREIALLPVVRASARRSRIPISLRFTAAMLTHPRARRRLVPADRYVAGFHRPATDLGLGAGPRWRVVHLSVADLTTSGSESRWRKGALLLRALERRSFRRMDRIYVVNQRVAERYRREFPEIGERIEFISNWADPTIFKPVPAADRHRQRVAVRQELGLPRDAPIVLFAGRLEGQKDPLLLAKTFARLRSANASACLVVAGDGALMDAVCSELAASGALDVVRFVGIVSRERLAELMNASDALAITSAFETGPTVGLEALACGLPVVTTPVGEVAGLVAATGAGRATGDRDPTTVARALGGVLGEGDGLRAAAVAAATPFLADRVLRPFYEENRRLAARLAATSLSSAARSPRAPG
jgi:glycosyltransferase involved in cell wall biosynthesis